MEHTPFRPLPEFKDYAVYLHGYQGHNPELEPGAKYMYGFERTDVLGRHFSFLYPWKAWAPETPEYTFSRRH
jgi:hypothetical protein